VIQVTEGAAPFWVVLSTVASAGASVVLAAFAGLQLWREHLRKGERRRSAHAKIGASAFLARRQLRSWLGAGSGSPDDLGEWVRDAQSAGLLAKHLDIVEGRFVELLSFAVDAEPAVASAVQSAAVHFWAGTRRLNEFLSTPCPDGIEAAEWMGLRDNAWLDLRDCVRILDQKAGANALLKEARALDAKRAADDPSAATLIARFDRGLERLGETEHRGALDERKKLAPRGPSVRQKR